MLPCRLPTGTSDTIGLNPEPELIVSSLWSRKWGGTVVDIPRLPSLSTRLNTTTRHTNLIPPELDHVNVKCKCNLDLRCTNFINESDAREDDDL